MFMPKEKSKGYSYFEFKPGDLDYQSYPGSFNFQKYGLEILDDIPAPVRDAVVDQILRTKHARHATTFVWQYVRAVYKIPGGKDFIHKVARCSLDRPIHGAAAISHVSKVVRSHAIAGLGGMVYDHGKLLVRYARGDIDGAELGKGVFVGTMGHGGDMIGWTIGSSIAAYFTASLLCPPLIPVAAAVAGLAGSAGGRGVTELLARYVAEYVTSVPQHTH